MMIFCSRNMYYHYQYWKKSAAFILYNTIYWPQTFEW